MDLKSKKARVVRVFRNARNAGLSIINNKRASISFERSEPDNERQRAADTVSQVWSGEKPESEPATVLRAIAASSYRNVFILRALAFQRTRGHQRAGNAGLSTPFGLFSEKGGALS